MILNYYILRKTRSILKLLLNVKKCASWCYIPKANLSSKPQPVLWLQAKYWERFSGQALIILNYRIFSKNMIISKIYVLRKIVRVLVLYPGRAIWTLELNQFWKYKPLRTFFKTSSYHFKLSPFCVKKTFLNCWFI